MGKGKCRSATAVICVGLGLMAATLAGCGANPRQNNAAEKGSSTMTAPTDSTDTRAIDAQSEEQWAYSVGVQNYVFGLPLTIFERER
jgi:hypothetical protein